MKSLKPVLSLPEPNTMKKRFLVAFCVVVAASGMARADKMGSDQAVQRVVATIRADIASEGDCIADDDLHRFQLLTAAPARTQASPAGPAAAKQAQAQEQARMARIERQLRGSPAVR